MIDPTAVHEAMGAVAALVRADGGDLVLGGIGEDTVDLELVLETAECRECVMPGPILGQVAHDMLAVTVPGLREVRVRDPRQR